jgi:hypothetical protein
MQLAKPISIVIIQICNRQKFSHVTTNYKILALLSLVYTSNVQLELVPNFGKIH